MAISGCALSTLELFTLNQKGPIVSDEYKVSSCEELDRKSTAILGETKNMECISSSFEAMHTAAKRRNAASNKFPTDRKELLAGSRDFIKAGDKYMQCKATDLLTFADLKEKRAVARYYVEAHKLCSTKERADFVEQLYIVNIDEHTKIYDSSQYTVKNSWENDGRAQRNLEKLISEIDSYPVLNKVKKSAPDYLRTEINGIIEGLECPLLFFVEKLKSDWSIVYSDFGSTDNYKFTKKGNNILIMKVGSGFEITFEREGNRLIPIQIKGDDKYGDKITSKNTLANNWRISDICLSNKRMNQK